ncbi:MAG: hypothetical protein R2750_09645 [Bacteroidales bacterium]
MDGRIFPGQLQFSHYARVWIMVGRSRCNHRSFSGSTNTGNQNKAFTQNGDGWNLIGNPYPSSLDWEAVTIPAELNGAIWLFDPTIGCKRRLCILHQQGWRSKYYLPIYTLRTGIFVRHRRFSCIDA